MRALAEADQRSQTPEVEAALLEAVGCPFTPWSPADTEHVLRAGDEIVRQRAGR